MLGLSACVLPAGAAQGAPATPPELPARWLLTGPIHDARYGHAATLLADGRVLVCGGQAVTGTGILDSCEVWDPETERWTPAGRLAHPRVRPAAIRLADDRVAFVGGYDNSVDQSPRGARYAVDVWDPRSRGAAAAGALPFPAEHPLVARLPNGRLFVTDDGPNLQQLRAASWNPANGRSSIEEAPNGPGQSAALLVDAHGTLTLVRSAIGCRQTTIWRRRAGEAWVAAHVEPSVTCATGAIALDEQQIVYWSNHANPILWNVATGVARPVGVPRPDRFERLVAFGDGRLLAIDDESSHLYVPGSGWRSAGSAGGDGQSTFTPVRDGRVLMLAPLSVRVWTPLTYAAARPCSYLTAELRAGVELPLIYYPQPTRDNVDPICWAAIASDPSLEVSRALKDLSQKPAGEGGRQGIQLLCDVRAAWAVDIMIRGLDSSVTYSGAHSCLAALAQIDQPAAHQAVDSYVQDCIRGDRGFDTLIEASKSSTSLRARAAEVLVAAWHDRRPGFDRLRSSVCQPPIPGAAAEICRKAEPQQEFEWRQQPKRRHALLMTGAVTAIGAGLAVGGALNQNNDLGQGLAIAAGTLGASALFVAPLLGDNGGGPLSALGDAFKGCAAVTGGLLGLVGSALATSSPGVSRTVVSIFGSALFTSVSLAAIWKF